MSEALSFQILSGTVFLAKSLLSEYAALLARPALSDLFL